MSIDPQREAEIDYLHKKYNYDVVKTDSNVTQLPLSQEYKYTRNIVASSDVWIQTDLLNQGLTGSSGVIQSQIVKMTSVHDVGSYKDKNGLLVGQAWDSGIKNWISPKYNKVFEPAFYVASKTATALSFDSNNSPLPANTYSLLGNTSDYPFIFDYQSGILTFLLSPAKNTGLYDLSQSSSTSPPYTTDYDLWIKGYTYIGNKLSNIDFTALSSGSGSTGATGAIGPTGANGNDGAIGPTGAQGADGRMGPQGPVGPTGPPGQVTMGSGSLPNGTYMGDYFYWNSTNSDWEIGSSNVRIGANAGYSNQGTNAIAIGKNAGYTGQAAGSIVLNATGNPLNAGTTGFYVAPVRDKLNIQNKNIANYTYTTTNKALSFTAQVPISNYEYFNNNTEFRYIFGGALILTNSNDSYSFDVSGGVRFTFTLDNRTLVSNSINPDYLTIGDSYFNVGANNGHYFTIKYSNSGSSTPLVSYTTEGSSNYTSCSYGDVFLVLITSDTVSYYVNGNLVNNKVVNTDTDKSAYKFYASGTYNWTGQSYGQPLLEPYISNIYTQILTIAKQYITRAAQFTSNINYKSIDNNNTLICNNVYDYGDAIDNFSNISYPLDVNGKIVFSFMLDLRTNLFNPNNPSDFTVNDVCIDIGTKNYYFSLFFNTSGNSLPTPSFTLLNATGPLVRYSCSFGSILSIALTASTVTYYVNGNSIITTNRNVYELSSYPFRLHLNTWTTQKQFNLYVSNMNVEYYDNIPPTLTYTGVTGSPLPLYYNQNNNELYYNSYPRYNNLKFGDSYMATIPPFTASVSPGYTGTTSNGYAYYGFTGSSSLTFTRGVTGAIYFAVGGGGGGSSSYGGGGGGGLQTNDPGLTGTVLSSQYKPGLLTLSKDSTYILQIGAGGTGAYLINGTNSVAPLNGQPTVFSGPDIVNINAFGGGAGGQVGLGSGIYVSGRVGGCGGGGTRSGGSSITYDGGVGYQGYNGGLASTNVYSGGGGGGIGGVGGNINGEYGGNGGAGITYSMVGRSFGGGGGGGGFTSSGTGTHGGGNGGTQQTPPVNGTPGTGGGGGGDRGTASVGGNGGSGAFILMIPISQLVTDNFDGSNSATLGMTGSTFQITQQGNNRLSIQASGDTTFGSGSGSYNFTDNSGNTNTSINNTGFITTNGLLHGSRYNATGVSTISNGTNSFIVKCPFGLDVNIGLYIIVWTNASATTNTRLVTMFQIDANNGQPFLITGANPNIALGFEYGNGKYYPSITWSNNTQGAATWTIYAIALG